LLNAINYQTLIATRAARLRDVAGPEAKLLEFGTRRAFGPQAAVWAARAALAAGFDGTSNVLAALKLGRKPVGTIAHALVMAVAALEGSENHAFAAFHRYFPGAPLLIDTYDTVAAARMLADRVNSGEMQLEGVRLDSGDLAVLSREVRSILPGVPIFASGDLDDREIAKLKNSGACIDGYGLGTKLVSGSPVNGVYKLVEIDGIPVMKEASGKVTYPGRKQIFRHIENGEILGDCLGLSGETIHNCDSYIPLMNLVVKEGKRVQSQESLDDIAKRTAASVASLRPETRQLDNPVSPSVEISTDLHSLTQKTKKSQSILDFRF
jgi:nicotinate phosphoribosyltransferase